MTKYAIIALYSLSSALLLDLIAYFFFGQSLAYCPAEGSCWDWQLARCMAAGLLGLVATTLQTNKEEGE